MLSALKNIFSHYHSTGMELQKLTNQDSPLIDQLNSTLNHLDEVFLDGDNRLIKDKIDHIEVLLDQILSNPIENLKKIEKEKIQESVKILFNLLEKYLAPTFSDPQPDVECLKQAFKSVKDLIKEEVSFQQGLFARGIDTLFNQSARNVKKFAQKIIETKSSTQQVVFDKHPLRELRELIGKYQANDDVMDVSQEKELERALCCLDQKVLTLKGIEAQVYKEIPKGNLHKNLDHLIKCISNHIKQPELDEIKDIEKLWNEIEDLDKSTELIRMENLLKIPIKDPIDLHSKLNVALQFFKERTDQETHRIVTQWLSLFYNWMNTILEPSQLNNLEKKLNHLKQQMNQGKYDIALTEFKKEIENSPLLHRKEEEATLTSPLNMIQEMKEKQVKNLLNKDQIKTSNRNKEIEEEEQRLIKQIGYLTSFKITHCLIEYLFGPSTHSMDLEGKSYESYVRIMSAVSKVPIQEQKEIFFKKIKEEMHIRKDLPTIKKYIVYIISRIAFYLVNFLISRFISSFINYLIHTLSLSTKHPLSTIHLHPIERINDCFIAQKKAFSNWAHDDEGKKFGALGRKKALRMAMRAPELNGGYEYDQLIRSTVKYAIAQFLTIKGIFSDDFYDTNHALNNWVNKSSGIKYYLKGAVTVFPKSMLMAAGFIIEKIESIGSMILRFATKRIIFSCNLSNLILDSMKNLLYEQSQRIHIVDEILLDQLMEIEKLLEEELPQSINREGIEVKKLFEEAVANAVQLVDIRNNLTAEAAKQEKAHPDNILSQGIEKLETFADNQMRDVIVEVLMTAYQSILTEKKMHKHILKILQKTKDQLFPQTLIQDYYSSEEKKKIEEDLGHKPTDQDLKKVFANSSEKNLEEITDADIELQMKEKFNRKRQALQETASRIIEKTVHKVVQKKAKQISMRADESAIYYIDFIEFSFFQAGGFFQKMDSIFKTKEENFSTLNKEMLLFLNQYEERQQLIDEKISGTSQFAEYVRSINKISNECIIPQFKQFHQSLERFSKENKESSYQNVYEAFKKFGENVYQRRVEIMEIKKQLQLKNEESPMLLKFSFNFGNRLIQYGGEYAEHYTNQRLQKLAEGVFDLYKDPNTLESFLRHVVMLNFIENSDNEKKMKV